MLAMVGTRAAGDTTRTALGSEKGSGATALCRQVRRAVGRRWETIRASTSRPMPRTVPIEGVLHQCDGISVIRWRGPERVSGAEHAYQY